MPRRIEATFPDGQTIFRNAAVGHETHAWRVTYTMAGKVHERGRFVGYTGPRETCRAVGFASSRDVAMRRTWKAIKEGGPRGIVILAREVVPIEVVNRVPTTSAPAGAERDLPQCS